jgi:hypothetical protein
LPPDGWSGKSATAPSYCNIQTSSCKSCKHDN